jgi:hypothetical protein
MSQLTVADYNARSDLCNRHPTRARCVNYESIRSEEPRIERRDSWARRKEVCCHCHDLPERKTAPTAGFLRMLFLGPVANATIPRAVHQVNGTTIGPHYVGVNSVEGVMPDDRRTSPLAFVLTRKWSVVITSRVPDTTVPTLRNRNKNLVSCSSVVTCTVQHGSVVRVHGSWAKCP